MTTADTDRDDAMILKGLRARLAEATEREAQLPRALCRICGGVIAKGQGVIEPESAWSSSRRQSSEIIDRERVKKGLPPLHNWRRSHTGCAGGPERTIRALTGIDVTPAVAAAALAQMFPRRYTACSSHPDPGRAHHVFKEPKPQPWSHLSDVDLVALAAAVRKTHDPSMPRRCRDGACAWCGVSRSLSWHKSSEKWADGSEAPLCGDCYPVWRKRGASGDREDRRANALEALSGAAWFPMTGGGIRCYVDIAGDDRGGTLGRWEYAHEPLAELRETARIKKPESLPGEIRDEYREKRRQAMLDSEARAHHVAELAAAEAEQAEREAAIAAGWPLST
ncbi:hypothetical protein ACTU6V_12710 [Microbacterium sp. A204]|uniref:hypothetical protein n=1 Tax=Microbacterium sp. A204 TaxID=3457321 RepID=UPI003FD2343F